MGSGFDVLDYPLALQMPHRLTDVNAWQPHLPFAFALVQLMRPKRFVELGTHKGDSYCGFCQAIDILGLDTLCHAVDTWVGDEQAGHYGPEVFAELKAYHDPRYGRFSTLVKGLFDDALEKFDDATIDLLHIDGLHTYDAVKHDFEAWLPKMTCRGVVLLHDVNEHQADFGVWRFWREIAERYAHGTFQFGHGLGIAAVGEEAAQALGPLFREMRDNPDLARYFSVLGERVLLHQARRMQIEEQARQTSVLTAQFHDRVEEQARQANMLTAQLRDRVEEQARQTSALAAQIQGRTEKQIGRLIAQKDALVAEKYALAGEKDALIAEKDAYMRQTERYVAELEASWREKNAHIAMLESLVQRGRPDFFPRSLKRMLRVLGRG